MWTSRGVVSVPGMRTACYTAILDRKGECHYGVGDMDIHGRISPQLVERLSSEVQSSRLVVMDGNIPEETIKCVLQLCKDTGVPVWFEPTDIRKASKPFHSELWRSLHFISPNFNELRVMAKAAGYYVNTSLSVEKNEGDQILEEASKLAVSLVKHIQVSIVTLGKLGVMVVRRGLADEPLLSSPTQKKSETTIYARVYGVPHLHSVVSVSGAGDWCGSSKNIPSINSSSTSTAISHLPVEATIR
uniref:Carbohydrate kinase PfkB domain-containing protein n=1 Tax=Timema genevievae TaxID=629358 RepID=A0A7R9PNI0_TIMGE|nr:unnamed protein product [Timema genevievae]